MRIAYLECFAGVAGDMFLGALLDAGVPPHVLHDATAALNLGAKLKIERVDRSGITATKVHVLDESGELAEKPHSHEHEHFREQQGHTHAHHPETQHQHKGGHHDHPHEHEHGHEHEHKHGHEHPHTHGRSLTEIRRLITEAALAEPVKHTALRAFELLGTSEAKIHNVPVEHIHFHEVGAVDAIVDIVATSAGIYHLGVDRWYCSAINVGGGMVECAHGTFPVPAPATADLLRGTPTYSAHIQKELVTPTGAALLRAIAPEFGAQPAMQADRIGYGAGTRNPHGFPNVLRLSIGAAVEEASAPPHSSTQEHTHRHAETGTVTVLETALDDLQPQVLAYVSEKALAAGALDVMLTPVIMKKGRPGTLLTILANPEQASGLEDLLLRETSTLGVHRREDKRSCLERRHATVETPYGAIRVKIGLAGEEERNVQPEFEDCRAAAEQHGVALKLVQQAALANYLGTSRG